jgi:transposase
MRFIGIDLHKRSMTACVIDQKTGETFHKTLPTNNLKVIQAFFEGLVEFQAVMEATATYEWLWELLEPFAQRLLLAHPKKIKVISESMAKTDRRDAYFLAWLLSQDAIPEAHRPTPRQRAYQQLVRHRVSLVRERVRIRVKMRNAFANRNIQDKGLFTTVSPMDLAKKLPAAERFCVEENAKLYLQLSERIETAEKKLDEFRKGAPEAEKKNHGIVCSVPGVGKVTADVVLSTLGKVERFSSVRKVGAYSGLIPGMRSSDKKRKELPITKEGPRLLRWALVEAAWRSLRSSPYWKDQFGRIARTRGKKKAIVAIARRILGVIFTLLKKGERYVERAKSPPALSPPVHPSGGSKSGKARTALAFVGTR